MRRGFALLLGLGLALSVHAEEPAGTPSATDEALAAVQELGRINGLALACRYADVAARVKGIMIARAPKMRGYGEVFETATSEAFAKPEASCPDAALLNVQAELAAGRLPEAQTK